MPYLTSTVGGYTPESRSILKILKKVFFKENTQLSYIVLHSMIHCERHHGMLFLVNQMKDLKSRIISGLKLPRRNTKNGLVVGLRKLDKISQLKLLSLMYRWKAKTPTRRTYARFIKSINQGRSDIHINRIPGYKFGFQNTEIQTFIQFLDQVRVDFSPLDSEGAHVLEGGNVADGPQHIADEIYAMCESGDLFLRHQDYLQEIFTIPDSVMKKLENKALHVTDPFVGRIAALQKDGGLKLRHVANLMKGWQVAISPLVKFYKLIESTYGQSANWNQFEGACKAAAATKDGFNLSSFDVVSSTDNIPRKLFFMLMDPVIESIPDSRKGRLVKSAYAIDKELCSEGVYLTPFNQRAWYDIGQAMGRWTSKSQLNLTMIKLTSSCGGTEHNSSVNGDDVIIWDDQVSKKFEKLLDIWNIPISVTKSFIRQSSGEFSGKIITREEGILPVVKGSKENLESDPFGSLRQYGSQGLNLYGKMKGMVVRVAKYLGGKQTDVDEYLRETKADENISNMEKEFISDLNSKPFITKQSSSQQWVDQVFVSEHHKLKQQMDCASFGMDYDPEMFSNPSLHGQYKEHYHKCRERLSRLHDFRHVAVKRFSPPISRLDMLVDNLNSRIVKTSDNQSIEGFGNGEVAKLYERLFKKPPDLFQTKSRDQDTHAIKKARMRSLRNLNRLIKSWERELKHPNDATVSTKKHHPSLLMQFFNFVVYGSRFG